MNENEWELLDRYLSGNATPEERICLEQRLAEHQLGATFRDELQVSLDRGVVDIEVSPEMMAAVWAQLQRTIQGGGDDSGEPAPAAGAAPEVAPVPVEGPMQRQPWRRPPAVVIPVRSRWNGVTRAVAALVLLSAGVLVGRWIWQGRGTAERGLPPRVIATPAGQRAEFLLPDGTKVMLGVASTIRQPADYGRGAREIALEGEAYFEVVHDERRPFIVRAGDIVAKDLGTEFTVRAYPEDAHARVVVREGQVALRAAVSDTLPVRVVEPGQLGRLAADGKPTVEQVDISNYFAWTDGRLVLDAMPLRDALPQLSRWFGLNFELGDSSIADIPLTATLRTQPTADVLDNLAASLGVHQVRRGRTVTFYRGAPDR